jgi:DNA-binding response OmpR family regulator
METRGTILVVEEAPDIVGFIREGLVQEGYRVLVAPSIAAALDILAAIRVRLVITDAFHPAPGQDADRWSPLAPLAAAAGEAPIILCTGRDRREYADLAAHGFAAFLPKPFDPTDLSATVRAALECGARPVPVADQAPRQELAPSEC